MQEGKITKVLFADSGSGYLIAIAKAGEIETKIAGYLYGVKKGDTICYEGNVTVHKKYGEQLAITRWEKPLPQTEQGVIDFLSSGVIRNVGPIRAVRIARALGAGALELIQLGGPDVLRSIPGIGKRADDIYRSIIENTELQTTARELAPMGINPRTIARVYKRFGSGAGRLIKQNPYRLIEVDYIGFQTADSVALKYGIERNSPFRLHAALIHSLIEASSVGHCYLPVEELISVSLSILNNNAQAVISERELTDVAVAAVNVGDLIRDGINVYLPRYRQAEKEIAEKVSGMCFVSGTLNLGPAIGIYEKKTGTILAAEQKEAIKSLCQNNILVLTGGPGTGKTETIRAITAIYKTLYPAGTLLLASPTARASRRMAEVTGMNAGTIHRLLGIRPGGEALFNKENPLNCDLLIIDEVSMLDVFLARQLFRAIPENAKVLLVGDKDQLPSVGPGNVLTDMLAAGVPAVSLTKIFRQAEQSQIVTNSHKVNSGNKISIDPAKDDFFHIKTDDPSIAAELVKRSVLRLIKKGYTLDEIQVLSPMRKNNTGVNELNKALQEALKKPGAREVSYNNQLFREGDKVIQTVNNYDKEIFNGDVGIAVKIGPLYDDGVLIEKTALYVRYSDKTVAYLPNELAQISLAYVITIHKSQGSEYKAVILVLTMQHYIMLARNLLYTAMTRAKEMFCLIGCDRALNIAIKNNAISKRNTGLAALINSQPSKLGAAV